MNNAKAIIIFIYACILAVLSILFYAHGKNIIFHLSQVEWKYIAILICLNAPFIASGGLSFQLLCLSHKIPLHWKTWLGLSFIASFVNQLLPFRAGMAFRYFYLHNHYKMQPITFLTIMTMYFIILLMISAAFTLVGWMLGNIPHTFSQFPLFAGGIFVILVLVFFVINHLRKLEPKIDPEGDLKPPLLTQWFAQLRSGCIHLFSHPLYLFAAIVGFIVFNTLSTLIVYVTFLSFETPVPFTDCLFLAGLIQLTMIFPLTPGNIGILEMIFGTLTQILYKDFGLGFSAIALYRACNWVPSITLGSLFSFWLAGSFLPPSLQRLRLGSERQLG